MAEFNENLHGNQWWRLTPNNIITLALLTITLVSGWYQFDNRLSLAEERVTSGINLAALERSKLEDRMGRLEVDRETSRDRLTRLEVRLDSIGNRLDEIARQNTQAAKQAEDMAKLLENIARRLEQSNQPNRGTNP